MYNNNHKAELSGGRNLPQQHFPFGSCWFEFAFAFELQFELVRVRVGLFTNRVSDALTEQLTD